MVTTTVDENGVEYLVPDYPDLDEAYPKDLLRMSYLRHNRIPDLYASGIILSVVAIVAVVLRGMARRKTKQKFGWDDYAIMVGLVIPQMRFFPFRAGSGLMRNASFSFSL